VEPSEKRALFLGGAATMTVAELREWCEEIRPGTWESIPQSPIDDQTPLLVSVFATPTL